jgi:hypothetical protein
MDVNLFEDALKMAPCPAHAATGTAGVVKNEKFHA